MAYDKIIAIHSRLDKCLDYSLNEEKTDLQMALEYIGNPEKNEAKSGILASALNCNLETAYQEMQNTKKRWSKEGGVLGYHLIHSFAPGEVEPEQAHRLGLEFASRLLGGRYEAVISTHLDKAHLHCHIVFNSVSFVDGKKYHNTFKDYYGDIRGISNEVSREQGLSVIEPAIEAANSGRPYAEWQAEQQGKFTLRDLVRQDLDKAIAQAYTLTSFWQILAKMGYQIKRGQRIKHTAVRPPQGKRFIRLDSLGEEYSEKDIEQRLTASRFNSFGPNKAVAPKMVYRLTKPRYKPRKLKGFIALYYKYLYLLGVIPKRRPVRNPAQRAVLLSKTELLKFERYQRQFRYLTKRQIGDDAALAEHLNQLQAEKEEMTLRRQQLYKIRRTKNCHADKYDERIGVEIEQITEKLRELRREIKLCEQIEEDIPKIRAKTAAEFKRQPKSRSITKPIKEVRENGRER